jgi:hypothetical protein
MILSSVFLCVQSTFLGRMLTLGLQELRSPRRRLLRRVCARLLGGRPPSNITHDGYSTERQAYGLDFFQDTNE